MPPEASVVDGAAGNGGEHFDHNILESQQDGGFPRQELGTQGRKPTKRGISEESHDPADNLQPRSKAARMVIPSMSYPVSTITTPVDHQLLASFNQPSPYQSISDDMRYPDRPVVNMVRLTKKQKKTIRNWYKDHATSEGNDYVSREVVGALATLIKAPPDTIWQWMSKRFFDTTQRRSAKDVPVPRVRSQTDHGSPVSNGPYSLAGANSHLSSDVLELIEKYVRPSHRRRTQSDGRRRINKGPYACTFGCGYQTKRTFDWRRHEETHQPQRLWLCHACREPPCRNPFLVNRSDKLLQHIKDSHKGSDAESVLEASDLKFRADFVRKCHLCEEQFGNWDERCKHILRHYDTPTGESAGYVPCPSDQSSEDESQSSPDSESDDTSDDDADKPDKGANRRDTTGGSGGGSGNLGGYTTFGNYAGGNNEFSGRSQAHNSLDYASEYGTSFNRGEWPARANLKDTSENVDRWTERATIGSSSNNHNRRGQKDHTGSGVSVPVGGAVMYEAHSPAVCTTFDIANRRYPHQNVGDIRRILKTELPIRQAVWQHQPPSLTLLGHGAHGFVDTVQQYVTGKVYARKRSNTASFPMEVETLKKMNHPHIVKYISAYIQNASLNLIMSPVAQSTLKERLAISANIQDDGIRLRKWIGCLSSALAYIHTKRIRHADIKPYNILVRDSDVFITDFGISRVVSETDSTSSSVSPSTPFYAAKEIAERLRHGRKADVFSLGCVFLEILTVAQGRSVADLHKHLGLSTKKRSRSRPAYWRVHDKVLSWIKAMKSCASAPVQTLWDVCEQMLRNQPDERPSSSQLLDIVRRVLESSRIVCCLDCMIGPPEPNRISLSNRHGPEELPDGTLVPGSRASYDRYSESLVRIDCRERTASERSLTPISRRITELDDTEQTCPEQCVTESMPTLSATPSDASCRCVSKARGSIFDMLTEYFLDPNSFCIPDLKCYPLPPAYDELGPNNPPITVFSISCGPNQPWSPIHSTASMVAEKEVCITDCVPRIPANVKEANPDQDADEMHGMNGRRGEAREDRVFTPRMSLGTGSHPTCHMCHTGFVAPRLKKCRNCAHIRCEQCTANTSTPNIRRQGRPRKADSDLAAIGSHLLPPAYSLLEPHSQLYLSAQNDIAFTGPESEQAVFNKVIAQNQSHGDDPAQRFIFDRPSTFDLMQSSIEDYNTKWYRPIQHSKSIVDDITPARPSTLPRSSHPVQSTSTSPEAPATKRVKLNTGYPLPSNSPVCQTNCRLSRHQSRQFVSGRSAQSVKKHQEMRTHNSTSPVPTEVHELKPISRPQRSEFHATHGGDTTVPRARSRTPRMSRSHSIDSAGSDTSTPASEQPGPLHKAGCAELEDREQGGDDPLVEVVQGGDNHTSYVPLSSLRKEHCRRSEESFRSVDEMEPGTRSSANNADFYFYGRHGNTWLFGDFSLTDTVKKRVNRLLHGRNEERGSGDE